MKHTPKITLIILGLFFATQLLGLVVVKTYTTGWQVQAPDGEVTNITREIPYGLEPPEVKPQISLISIITAIIVATLLILMLSKIRATFLLRLWFAFVVLITLAITISTVIHEYAAIAFAGLLTFYKIWKRNMIIHNFTELLIYPGLAVIFVPILSIGVTIILLLFLSVYDFYAVIKSKHMIKLAKFQIKELKIFTGFFLPYINKADLKKIKAAEKLAKIKGKLAKSAKQSKIKVNLAILGGGDVAFPLIFAGVVMKSYAQFGLLYGAIIAIFATLSLAYLLFTARRGKFYPAMPFITAGLLLGFACVWLLKAFVF